MKRYLNGDDLFAEVKMVRTSFGGTILLLEGESDCRLFDSFLETTDCRSIPGRGKQSVLEAMEAAAKAGLKGIVAIVDADYWHIDAGPPTIPGLLVTEYHDVEMLLLTSGSFNRFVREVCSPEKVDKFSARTGTSLLRALLQRASPMGALRLVNERKGLSLHFGADWSRSKALGRESLEVDISRFIGRVLQDSGFPASPEDAATWVAEVLSEGHDPRQLCCGHDVIHLVSLGLRKALSTLELKQSEPHHIEEMLRMAYRLRDLRKSDLYSQSKDWEAGNPPFRIFEG